MHILNSVLKNLKAVWFNFNLESLYLHGAGEKHSLNKLKHATSNYY